MKELVKHIIAVSLMLIPAVAISADKPTFDNIHMVIGSTDEGGDTYQAAAIVAKALEKKLNTNINIDAAGTSAGYAALKSDRSGNTIMVTHDQAYLGTLYGTTGYDDIFNAFKVGPSFAINPTNAYLVPKNSKFTSLDDVIEAVGHGERVKVAIQSGSTSEIGFSAIKNAIKLKYPGMEKNLVALNTGSQSSKDQLLFDGIADVIQGSLSSNEQFTRLPADDKKAMRFIWLTSKKTTIDKINKKGFGEMTKEKIDSYVSPNVILPMDSHGTINFTFDKEFFIIYGKDMPQDKIDYIDQALKELYSEGEINKNLEKAFFVPNFLDSMSNERHLFSKQSKYKIVLDNIK